MTTDAYDKLAERLRNWGRWGADDQRGTLNHIGPAALKRAAASVKQGKMFSLGLKFDAKGPQLGYHRFNPMKYVISLDARVNPNYDVFWCDDVIHMPLQCSTQWDALSHVHYDGQLYNGFKTCEHLSVAHGAHKCGVEHMAAPGLCSRGVLLDIARLKGADILPATYVITPDDLNEACAKAGVIVEPGDIILVRTGNLRWFTERGDALKFQGRPTAGVNADCAEWLYDKSAAAIAADNAAVEAIQMEVDPRYDAPLPLHMLALREMGLPLGEMFDLEVLAADCAEDGQYTFLISAPPLSFTGGFGSPVNPQVLK